MNTAIQNGYAEVAPAINEEEGNQQVWYIPHHGYITPRNQTRYESSLTVPPSLKETLNKHVLQGPDMTNNLTGVKGPLPSCVTSKGCTINGSSTKNAENCYAFSGGKQRHLKRAKRVLDDRTSVQSHILTRLLKFLLKIYCQRQ